MRRLIQNAFLNAVVTLAVLAGSQTALRAESRDFAIELSARIERDPAAITLQWRPLKNSSALTLSRKTRAASSWSPIATLPAGATTYTDAGILPGIGYEYRLLPQSWSHLSPTGYIYAGLDLPLVETRGKIILLVDSTHTSALESELGRLQQDLMGDGWDVVRRDVSRQQSAIQVKEIVRAAWLLDPVNTKTLFIFGHVAVPYSGNLNPDGHDDHQGAWPADAYYGDLDGVWTDLSVNNTSAPRSANHNVPGDGKFDQSTIPSSMELQVGRVDLANINSFAPKTEVDLLRQYLNKDHNFRHGLLPVARRGLVNDNFGEMGGEAFAATGFRNFAPFFGQDTTRAIPGNEYFNTLKNDGYLFSYACGPGAFNSCAWVGGTGDWASDPKTVFTMLLGSYFGDWDAQDSFLRGPLGSPTYGLAAMWAGRPHWYLHHLALGDTLGATTQLNQDGGPYHPDWRARQVHVALMGDPTLRLHPVIPPAEVRVAAGASGVTVSWQPSTDESIVGYHIYSAASPRGPFQRLTPVPLTGTQMLAPAAAVYQVRAIKLETSGSGTYYNASQGIFATQTEPGTEEPPVEEPPVFDPDQPHFVPVRLQKTATGVAVSFPSQLDKLYAIETSSNLTDWSWTDSTWGTGQTIQVEDLEPGELRFFRVKYLPRYSK